MKNKKKVVVIGGGTGTYTILLGLKKYALDLSVIVSMMDDGGSNRVIRDEFGLLPTSDLRQCMVAMASKETDELMRKLFTYRYSQGTGITGMTFGNLFMAALTEILNSQEEAINKTCEILHVSGNILPVTYSNSHLVARYENGEQILGEHAIDDPKGDLGKYKIVGLGVFPKAIPNPKALKVIKKADYIVLGPGDLFTSILPNIVVDGVAKAIKNSKAKKIYVMNLMTKYGQTNDFSAKDHIEALEKYLGKDTVNYCLVNKNGKFPRGILARYKEEKAFLVKDDLGKNGTMEIIRKNFVSSRVYIKQKSDILKRSLIRHDSDKLAKAVFSLFK